MIHKRHKPFVLRRIWNHFRFWCSDIRHARRNAMAAYSARYILEDMDNPHGIEKIAGATGLPQGVISAALRNILR
jgi:hypothetical protein